MKLKSLIALLLAAAMLLGLLSGCATSPEEPETTTEATEPSTEPEVIDNYGKNDVTALADYAVTTATPDDEYMSAVIAVDADGNPILTNRVMQLLYWLEFYTFMSSYGSYVSYFGLDASAPLAGQNSLTENRTWEQYFLEAASLNFAEQYALYCQAKADGFTLSEEDQAYIDDISNPTGNLATSALEAGYESVEAYIQASFGPGVTLEDYLYYVEIFVTANAYYTQHYTELQVEIDAADEAALSAYYDANAETFEENRVSKVNNVSVRHILIEPEAADETATGYTDEEWAAAEAKANDVYALWQQNPTEDYFAELANEKSADPGSNTTGGLYEDFPSNQMVAEFSDWCFDQSRQPGDTGIVKTTYGYHIMYFVGQTETKAWMDTVREQMLTDKMTAFIDEQCEAFPLLYDYSKVRLFDVSTLQAEESVENESVQENTGAENAGVTEATEASE